MNSKGIYVIVIVVLFGYSIFEAILFNEMKNTANKYQTLFESREIVHEMEIDNINTYLDIVNTTGTSFNTYVEALCSAYDIQNKVVFFFREETCIDCIIDILGEIDTIVSGPISENDIVLVCQSVEKNYFDLPEFKKYKDNFRTIWISVDSYYLPLAHKPFFFIANGSKTSNYNLFIPELMFHYKNIYYSEVIPANISYLD